MGLRSNLPRRGKVDPKEALRRSYCDDVHDDLEGRGVDFFRPREEGGSLNVDRDFLSLPRSITEVPPRDLGEYLNAFTQQKMYMRTLEGYAEMYLEEARAEYSRESDALYLELSATRMTETAKERAVNADPRIRPLYEKVLDCKNRARLISLNLQSLEDAIFLISREVSRRSGDIESEGRAYGVHGG